MAAKRVAVRVLNPVGLCQVGLRTASGARIRGVAPNIVTCKGDLRSRDPGGCFRRPHTQRRREPLAQSFRTCASLRLVRHQHYVGRPFYFDKIDGRQDTLLCHAEASRASRAMRMLSGAESFNAWHLRRGIQHLTPGIDGCRCHKPADGRNYNWHRMKAQREDSGIASNHDPSRRPLPHTLDLQVFTTKASTRHSPTQIHSDYRFS